MFFYLIEQHSKFLLHTLQVLSAASYRWFSRTPYERLSGLLHLLFCYRRPASAFPFTHAPCLLKLCIPPSNGIVRWWLFPEFGAELPLDNSNWPTFMKCKHTKRLLNVVRRHLSKLRSKRRNALLLHTVHHKRNFENFLIHRCKYILISHVYCIWQNVKTPTIISNNRV